MISRRILLAACATVSLSAFAQFNPGNLAVLRVGDGTQTIANTGNTIFIDEYSPGGGLVSSTAIPDQGANALVLSGSATAEGFLSRSANGLYLTFAGYNTSRPFSASVATSPSATVPRGVGMLDINRNVSLPATSTTAYDLQSWRGAVTDGSGNYWGTGSGGGGGPYYMGNNSSPAMLQSSFTTLRGANIFNGNLYFSHTGSAGTGPGIYYFSGMPTAAASPSLLFATGAGAATTDFAINAAGNLAYVADDRATTAGGGIQKWTFDGTAWTLSYTLGTGTGSTVGTRGLAVDFSGAEPVLFATTAESSAMRLITITDTGSGALATTLATAGTNIRFRGLDFVPSLVPEPSVLALAGLGMAAVTIFRRRK